MPDYSTSNSMGSASLSNSFTSSAKSAASSVRALTIPLQTSGNGTVGRMPGRGEFRSLRVAVLELQLQNVKHNSVCVHCRVKDAVLHSKQIPLTNNSAVVNTAFFFPYRNEDYMEMIVMSDTGSHVADIILDLSPAGPESSVLCKDFPLRTQKGQMVGSIFARLEFGYDETELTRRGIGGNTTPIRETSPSHFLSSSKANDTLVFKYNPSVANLSYLNQGTSPTGYTYADLSPMGMTVSSSPVQRALQHSPDDYFELNCPFKGVAIELCYGVSFNTPNIRFWAQVGRHSLQSAVIIPNKEGDFRIDEIFIFPFNNQRKLFLYGYRDNEAIPFCVSGFDAFQMINNGIVSCRQNITFYDQFDQPAGYVETKTEFTNTFDKMAATKAPPRVDYSPAIDDTDGFENGQSPLSSPLEMPGRWDVDFHSLSFAILYGQNMNESIQAWRVGVGIGGYNCTMPEYYMSTSHGTVNFNYLMTLPYENQRAARLSLQGFTHRGAAVFGVAYLDLEKAVTSRRMKKKVRVVNEQGSSLGCVYILAQAASTAIPFVKSSKIAPENLHLLSSIPFDHLVDFCGTPIDQTSRGQHSNGIFCTRGMWASGMSSGSPTSRGCGSALALCGMGRMRPSVPKTWRSRSQLDPLMLPEETSVKNCLCTEQVNISSPKLTKPSEVETLFSYCPVLREIAVDAETNLTVQNLNDIGDIAPDLLEVKIYALRDIQDQMQCRTIRPQFLIRYGSTSLISRRLKPGTLDPNMDVTIELPFTARKYIYLDILESTCVNRAQHLGSVCIDLSDVKFMARRKIVEITNIMNQPCGFIFAELKYKSDPYSLNLPNVTVDYASSDNIAAEATRTYAGSPRANATSPVEKVCDFSSTRADDDFNKYSPTARTVKICLSSAQNLPNPFPFKKFDVYCSVKAESSMVDTPIVSRAGCDALFNFLIEFPVPDIDRNLEFEIYGLHPFGSETLLATSFVNLKDIVPGKENRFILPLISVCESNNKDDKAVLTCNLDLERSSNPYAVVKKLKNILPREIDEVF